MRGVAGLVAAGYRRQDLPDKRLNDVVYCGMKSGQEMDDERHINIFLFPTAAVKMTFRLRELCSAKSEKCKVRSCKR